MSESKLKCGKCIFRGKAYDVVGCDYATITGKTRKAQPAEKCTFFIAGARMEPEEYRNLHGEEIKPRKRLPGGGAKPKYDWEWAKELYDRGLNDGEIGRVMGIRPQTISLWRGRNRLPANTTPGGRR